MFRLNRFICSGIWTSKPFAIIIGSQCPILIASATSFARLSASALPTRS
jgi:hypothetical protein